MHLEVIDAGQAWTADPFSRAADQLHRHVSASAPASERWAELGRSIDSDLINGPDWLRLAEALDCAHDSGYDVEHAVPVLAARVPLPYRDAARELHARLLDDCPSAANAHSERNLSAMTRRRSREPTSGLSPGDRDRNPNQHTQRRSTRPDDSSARRPTQSVKVDKPAARRR
jgi:hypothetical protein